MLRLIRYYIVFRILLKRSLSDKLLKEDILHNISFRSPKKLKLPIDQQLWHLIKYYEDFRRIFLWRLNLDNSIYAIFLNVQIKLYKIFKSTKIEGGIIAFHPFGTVINAKSIGENFIFRNGLTIGNKNNDNSGLPILGDNIEVGVNVVILGNVTIGDNSIIGAGTIVTKNIPNNSIVYGNPIRIKKR